MLCDVCPHVLLWALVACIVMWLIPDSVTIAHIGTYGSVYLVLPLYCIRLGISDPLNVAIMMTAGFPLVPLSLSMSSNHFGGLSFANSSLIYRVSIALAKNRAATMCEFLSLIWCPLTDINGKWHCPRGILFTGSLYRLRVTQFLMTHLVVRGTMSIWIRMLCLGSSIVFEA